MIVLDVCAAPGNKTAQMISTAISEHNLIANRSGFVLMLKADGKHFYKKLA